MNRLRRLVGFGPAPARVSSQGTMPGRRRGSARGQYDPRQELADGSSLWLARGAVARLLERGRMTAPEAKRKTPPKARPGAAKTPDGAPRGATRFPKRVACKGTAERLLARRPPRLFGGGVAPPPGTNGVATLGRISRRENDGGCLHETNADLAPSP